MDSEGVRLNFQQRMEQSCRHELQGRLVKYMESERIEQLHWYQFWSARKGDIVFSWFSICESVSSVTCKKRTFSRIHSIESKA